MYEVTTTYALVVGIDRYDDAARCPELKGAVRDAIVAVNWLRKLGVPDTQIRLHASPGAGVKAELDRLGMSVLEADKPGIEDSIKGLAKVSGTRLFVFLMGHGLYSLTGGRLFLTREAGVDDIWMNLGLEYFIKQFRSLRFPRQFLFMDGCQNNAAAPQERERMKPGVLDSAPDPMPLAANGLVACFAAAQEQLATEIDGRGVFSRRLFEVLDLDLGSLRPGDDYHAVIEYDWTSGKRWVDLVPLIYRFVQGRVQQDARRQGRPQDVVLEPYGAAAQGQRQRIVQLANSPTAQVRVEVTPALAVADVTRIQVSAADIDFKCDLPQRDGIVHVPVDLRLPRAIEGEAYCWARDTAPWDENRAHEKFHTDADTRVALTFRPRKRNGGETFSVKTRTRDGSPAYVMGNSNYVLVADALGHPGTIHSDAEVDEGVRITLHEDGPEFQVSPVSLRRGSAIAHRVARTMYATLPRDVVVSTRLTGDVPPGDEPSVRFLFPPGGARSLAGPLAGSRAVVIGDADEATPAWLTEGALSLRELEADPVVQVDPGPQRVRVQLPWGSWTETIHADPSSTTTVHLPASVGVPPLRVRLGPDFVAASGELVILDGPKSVVAVRSRPGAGARSVLPQPIAGGRAKFLLSTLRPDARGGQTAVVTYADWRVEFPLFGTRSIALERGSGLRLEPLSDSQALEWDLLVSMGRLDALSRDDAVRIARESEDELLAVAAGYALYARGAWEELAVLAGELASRPVDALDVRLLLMAARQSGERKVLGPADVSELAAHAEFGDVPVFRWGVRLAVGFLEEAADVAGATKRWRRRLTDIERDLSPNSAWTAWVSRQRWSPLRAALQSEPWRPSLGRVPRESRGG